MSAKYGNFLISSHRNRRYRKVLVEQPGLKITVMNIPPGGDIPAESHDSHQILRVEAGRIRVFVEGSKPKVLQAGGFVVIPPNTEHLVVNASRMEKALLSSIYAGGY